MSGGAIIQMLPSLSVRVTSICSKGKDLGKHTVIGSTHLCNSIKLLILTRLPVCHPRLSTRFSILPRTHVWCSGRMSSPLFGIPSIRSPQFPQCPALSQKLLFRVNLQPPLSRSPPLSPSSTHWISHVLTRLSDTSDCVEVRSDQTCRLRLYAHSDTQWQWVPQALSRVGRGLQWCWGDEKVGKRWPLICERHMTSVQ